MNFGGEKIARFRVEEKVRPLTHIPQDSTFILEIEDPHWSLLRYIIQRKDMNMNGSPSAASLRTNKQWTLNMYLIKTEQNGSKQTEDRVQNVLFWPAI